METVGTLWSGNIDTRPAGRSVQQLDLRRNLWNSNPFLERPDEHTSMASEGPRLSEQRIARDIINLKTEDERRKRFGIWKSPPKKSTFCINLGWSEGPSLPGRYFAPGMRFAAAAACPPWKATGRS
ncbi:hypothetical protein EYF80_012046 [Liparis tanakae]|uniref:Uncharacterized protein n=1 Tax=Liparis tanakae TaxID=230148 RepID=A0A4Z2IIU9_9TELE|nr:hypothetical protein EYF80_012046 [Liparis tanakae]